MLKSKTIESIDRKVVISSLWIVVMLNMIFADILSLMIPGALTELMTGTVDGVTLSAELMLVAAIILEIPIMMVLLSRLLKYKTNRILNIVASIITIVFVIGGGSLDLHYIFFATVEVICMISIIIIAFKWRE